MKMTNVTATVNFVVIVDETKFTEEFMAEFRQSIAPFYTIEDHIEHLADLFVRGVADNSTKFIEGYGNPQDFGIKFMGRRNAGAMIDCPVDVDLIYDKSEAA